jgi:hypothetical protein
VEEGEEEAAWLLFLQGVVVEPTRRSHDAAVTLFNVNKRVQQGRSSFRSRRMAAGGGGEK